MMDQNAGVQQNLRPAWVDGALYPFADHWTAGLHHVDEGAGRPVLMVHGNPTWSFLYRKVIAGLEGFRRVAVDLPGFGLSPAPPGYGFTPAEHAEALAGLVEALDLRDYLLVGQDWGGPIGLAAAARAPERVAGLVLANTWAWSMADRPAARAWSLAIEGVPGRWAVERFNTFARGATRMMRAPAAVREHYTRPFPSPAARRPTWIFAREVTASGAWFDAAVAPAVRALADRPALIPWGARDPVFSTRDRDRLAALLPHAEVRTLAGAGHFLQEDAGEELALAIRERFGG